MTPAHASTRTAPRPSHAFRASTRNSDRCGWAPQLSTQECPFQLSTQQRPPHLSSRGRPICIRARREGRTHRCSKASSLCLTLTLTQTRTQTQTLTLTLSSTLSLTLTLTITLTLTLEGELATLLGDHGAGDAGVALAQQRTPSRRRRPPPRDQHCYATLLSHSSFLPGTLALLHSLRAGGALLPATVLATPSALLPGATALLERFARVRLLSAAVERATAPSAKALDMMRRKPSECEGGRAHARNETGMASAQDCSQWQRLSTYVKLRLFAPNATGCGVLLYLDADCLVRGNLDPVFTAFPYALTGSVRLSSAGNPGYWTTRKTGQNMSTNWPRLAEARGWRPP